MPHSQSSTSSRFCWRARGLFRLTLPRWRGRCLPAPVIMLATRSRMEHEVGECRYHSRAALGCVSSNFELTDSSNNGKHEPLWELSATGDKLRDHGLVRNTSLQFPQVRRLFGGRPSVWH